MKTLLVDTNIFLRFLTNDIPEQATRIEKRFRQAQKSKLKLFVLNVTVVEILFQLENWYQFSKNEAVEKLIWLFSPSWIEIENKEVILTALNLYQTCHIDYVDLLTWSIAKKRHFPILSFDKDYDKLTPQLRIEP